MTGPVRPSPRVVVPFAPSWYQSAFSWLAFALEQGLTATLRCAWTDPSRLFEGSHGSPVIFCVWHNRLALCMFLYRKHVCRIQKSRRMAAMVSASRDGALLAAILQRFGVEPVRGSTSRRGPQALRELTSRAREGYDLALTPDGPRGPRYCIQDGILMVAQLTGLPIIPVSYNTVWRLRLHSWDRFMLPLPFARCELNFGNPLLVPRALAPAERERFRRELQQAMAAITRD